MVATGLLFGTVTWNTSFCPDSNALVDVVDPVNSVLGPETPDLLVKVTKIFASVPPYGILVV